MLSLLRSLLSSCLFCCEYSVASWEKDRIRWVLKFPSVRVRDILKAVSYPWIMGWVSSWNHYKPHSSWLQAEAGNPGFNNFLSQCWLWPHWWLGCPACLCKPGDVCLQSTGSQVGSLKLDGLWSWSDCQATLTHPAQLHQDWQRAAVGAVSQQTYTARGFSRLTTMLWNPPKLVRPVGRHRKEKVCTPFVCSPYWGESGREQTRTHTLTCQHCTFLLHRVFVVP